MRRGKTIGLVIILIFGTYFFGGKFIKKNSLNKNISFDILPTVTKKTLKVAIMADIHSDGEQLDKMLSKAKEEQNDLVIIAGDLIEREGDNELINMKDILNRSKLKYAVIPGDREKNLNNFKNIFGSDYHMIEIEKVKFILLNNSSWHGLGVEQKMWIESAISDCREKICLAIMHKPLNNLFSAQIMGEGNQKVADEAKWLVQLLIKNGVKRIEAADLHYSTSYELEGIRTDIVGAISRLDNLQSSRYTELMISENSIERRVVEEGNDTRN